MFGIQCNKSWYHLSSGLVQEVFSVRTKDEVCTKHSHWKSLARSFLEQAIVCPERSDLSQKDVQWRGLISEVTVDCCWCVNRHHMRTKHRFTVLKARQFSLRMELHLLCYYAFFVRSAWRNALWTCRVCLSAWFNSRTTGRIRMKFGMEVVPLGTTHKSHFLIYFSR
jgi:hypothetical protein